MNLRSPDVIVDALEFIEPVVAAAVVPTLAALWVLGLLTLFGVCAQTAAAKQNKTAPAMRAGTERFVDMTLLRKNERSRRAYDDRRTYRFRRARTMASVQIPCGRRERISIGESGTCARRRRRAPGQSYRLACQMRASVGRWGSSALVFSVSQGDALVRGQRQRRIRRLGASWHESSFRRIVTARASALHQERTMSQRFRLVDANGNVH